jgi:type II secretory pathway pseudopilin PulG
MSPHLPDPGSRAAASASGFSLAETLVATALTLIVLSTAVGALMDGVKLGDMTRRVADTNQGLQAALALIVRDFIQTGHGIPSGGIPLPSGDGSVLVARPGPPGSVLTFPVDWQTIPAVSPGAGLGPVIRGQATDLISVIYADPTLALGQWPLAAMADDGSSMTVDDRTPIGSAGGLRPGDIIMFSNATGNALQMVTRTDHQVVYFDDGDPMHLNQRGAAAGSVMALRPGATFPPTTATRIILVSYYIDAVTDADWPRLVRQVDAGGQPAVALGTENLQFSFDLVDGLTNPANVKTPAVENSANQIRKVNIFLAGRSQDLDQTTQAFFRNAVATQVSLRSLSFMDRYR